MLTKEDIKKLIEVFSTKEDLERVKKGLATKKQFDQVIDKLNSHSDLLQKHSKKLDSNTTSLVNIENTIKGYADMYKVNKEKNEELDEKVKAIQENIGTTSSN